LTFKKSKLAFDKKPNFLCIFMKFVTNFSPLFSFLLQSLIFRNLIFHKNNKYINYIFNLKQKQYKRKKEMAKISLLYSQCAPQKSLQWKLSHLKKSVATFQIWKEKSLCPKKSFATKINIFKKKNCSPGLVCITELQKNHKNPEFEYHFLATFSSQVFIYFVKNQN